MEKHTPERRPTRQVRVGNVLIGGGAPVSIQSMTNTPTSDVRATVAQIKALEQAGCDIVRVAVPDMASAEAIKAIKAEIGIPLVADIHFDHRLALKAMACGADKIRINPGNIGSKEKVREVVNMASQLKIPIRVGVNSGSLEKHLLERYGGVCAEALAESAMSHAALLEDMGFKDIVISIKSSDVVMSYKAHQLLAEKTDYPLHIGITEAGTPYRGTIRSAVGIGALLLNGIGDTLRVSLTGDPVEEVRAAREILRACGLYRKGIQFISCPTCGRTQIDLIGIATKVEEALEDVDKPIKVAIMGCVVNGPGEAREADIGIAGGKGAAVLFKKGQIIKKIDEDEIVETLVREIKAL
ncbi:MAG TPA: flavodoxin-dependent (E)-4-hydroxy-3-methylbut-2-enyl-diphosphate synthase [Thermoclostridium caenicola]|uniref:4-hydroxy-3-methylbut-2-en-1-yl diphosphate synthase (flavodoxin) n=1 Tax=Thermoclostridium caenicola TaxID=659425 RepID=A0A1M6GH51_9FIRM|nr:flavodoxin-dependent (E)-4-hydroxy-3-methylbut-2-enyl-diphosphate synthase [Thermoclostridium caenicola]SHJ09277.1 4-hydroxy-3-methylbut-2-en-1-yl diphosphate synthase [Thermoclostridium caenicola]HOK43355.1 flavodoxin-dependent (E)-4-hydroxy-3-methylbut-2-enyl-diphosphate synthase [Thermoclostridium caenicola]HOL83886.1 flavodoxin-dependent (E)-4-hydroxy-3-methylbut-2-enyl-diphosphate synthase [Thermoclostridium caenicola]HPO75621.1 flavodoxin-dependent (E)-4-hydroxy-3-methylbut-2-enyl-diph